MKNNSNLDQYQKRLEEQPSNLKTKITYLALFVGLFGLMWLIEFNPILFISNIGNMLSILYELTIGMVIELITGDLLSYLSQLHQPMLQTVQMALIGTFFGGIVGFIKALLSSELLMRKKSIYVPFRILGSILRSVPTLLYASIFVVIFNSGAVPGIFAISIFSMTIIAKMTYENIDEIDRGPMESLESMGATKLQVARYAIFPQVLPHFVSVVLYTFEINVRASMILGYVGAGGIGVNLQSSFSSYDYASVGLITLYTLIVILIIDSISKYIRKQVI